MFYNDWLTKFKLKKPILIKFIYTFIVLFCSIIVNANLSHAEPSHAISMHGEPALPSDFPHFRYVNPEAPKKGSINYAWTGTFDSINPFIVQGTAARGIMDTLFGNLVFDSLMMRASDEPFTLYPLLAKTVETNDNRDFVEFTLDERAKFSDGEPVKPEDFIFTIELLKEKGWPRYATIANKIEKIEKIGSHGIKITFKKPDRELPLILANMIVLPKHAINPKTFEKSSLKPIIGSGPYIVETVQAGESINFKRNPNYWAANIPSMKGMHNYERIKLTYYRDENAMFESFRKGLTDVSLMKTVGGGKPNIISHLSNKARLFKKNL